MSAESTLTAVAVVRTLLNEDTEGLTVLLPDSLPESGRDLVASQASLAVLSARAAARAGGIPESEYLDRKRADRDHRTELSRHTRLM